MNTGIISVRYARALLKNAAMSGDKEKVYADMKMLAKSFLKLPKLRKVIENPKIRKEDKEKLLYLACGNNPCIQTQTFIKLVLKEGREDIIQFMANSYISLYRKDENIVSGCLTTAVPVDSKTQSKFSDIVKKRTDANIEFETKVDPEIIGGFILEYGTYRMDSSVQSQLSMILKQLK
jgi:F-type H+-transporting ATPase subunit delta